MPPAQTEHLFTDLPGIATATAGRAAHAAEGWLGASARAGRGRPAETTGLLALGRARVTVAMQIERRGTEVVFFFDKHELPVSRPASAQIAMSIVPERTSAPGAETANLPQGPGPARFEIDLPWFLVRPSEIESPSPLLPSGWTKAEAVWIRLDPEGRRVLGFVPSPAGRRAIRLVTPTGAADYPAPAGRFPVGPFLLVIAMLRAHQEGLATRVGPLALPGMTARNDAQVMLDVLASTCASAVAAVAAERLPPSEPIPACPCGHADDECPYRSPLPPELREALPAYEVGDFEADLRLQMGADGRLAPAGKPYTELDLHLSLRPTERGVSGRISTAPGDLLWTGERRESLLDRAAEEGDLADGFDSADHGKWDVYFAGAREQAVAIVSSNDDPSKPEIVLALVHAGITVLASLQVEIDEAGKISIESAGVFHDSRSAIEGGLAPSDSARLFAPLTRLRTWLSLL